MAPASAMPTANSLPSFPGRERLLTRPLVGFLLLLGLVLAASLASRWQSPDLAATVRLLADSDLDGGERGPMLQRLRELAPAASGATARWADWLAAIALEVPGTRGVPPAEAPAATDLPFLGLGDPVLAAALAAGLAELAGDRASAVAQWQLAATRSRLSRRGFVVALADEARQRLGS